MERLGSVLMKVGGAGLAMAVLCWIATFRHYFDLVGAGRAVTCLYSYSDTCRVGSGLVAFLEGGHPLEPSSLRRRRASI